jgi:hypothetical protein
MYRAYYAAGKCSRVPPLEKDRWPFKQFLNLDEALFWSRAVVKQGTSIVAIEGDDGTQLSKSEIAGYVRQNLRANA